MSSRIRIAAQTRGIWLIDLAVFMGGILAALSGIYFLFAPSGGYQGGRNPMYGITILFSRYTWEDVHLWGGLAMIAAVLIHLSIHWRWFGTMARRIRNELLPGGKKVPAFVRFNLAVNVTIGLSFLVCATSGVYFLFAPDGGFQGGGNIGWDPGFLFTRTTWDLIHTWSGIVMIVAAVLHFWIHWRWIKNVTAKFFKSMLPAPAAKEVTANH